ncbi:MAG TPA: hypothetical protein VHP81_12825, partial [Lachnospiraceae bacterium]|nr:hypothetical protein [Lachnospiraceae bacterium]
MENKDKVISFNGHRCCIFGFDNIEEAVKAMNFEFIKDYGDTFLNEDGSIKHYLHTWDDGERRLVRCKNCGAYFIRQASELHGSEDSYYIDWYQVESPDIAEKLNEIYSGWALEAEYKAPGMFMTNGKYHWNNANDIRDRQMELTDREESESKCEKKVLS